MKYKFFLLSAEEARDATKCGYGYIKAHQDRLISGPDLNGYLTVGYVKGSDFIVHEDKVYFILKAFLNTSDTTVILLCTESVNSCDVKTVF